jgi:naphthoate synthase/2-ketocyclohexanecarboxyl-CoA hydrolase
VTDTKKHKFTDILYDKTDGIGWITINRPETYNSITQHTVEEMTAAVTDAAQDPETGVIVITGAGEKSFSSGGNVQAMRERNSPIKRNHLRVMAHFGIALRTCGKPVIAMVNGYAIGFGHELHVMCDITIASENAKFGQTGPKISSVPVWATTNLLHRTVGEKRAREILYFCRQYTAHEALAMGLINAVVPLSELRATTEKWCRELLEKSPQSLRLAKLTMNQESDHSLWGGMFAGSELLSMHTDSEEYREGPTSFVEKRKANFGKYRRKPAVVSS